MNSLPRNFAPLLVVLSCLIASGIFWFGWQSYVHLKILERHEVEVFETSQDLDRLFREFHRALGFGGFIHNVKQYLLHREPLHLVILGENVKEVEAAYAELKTYFNPDETDRAIEKLDQFVWSIRKKYQLLADPSQRNTPAKELDLLLNIETPETLSALVTLETLKRRATEKSIEEIRQSITDIVQDLIVAAILLPLTLIAGISLAWLGNRNRQIKSTLRKELLINQELAQLGRALNAPGLSIKGVATRILESARKLTGSEHGFVSEIDRGTGENVGHTLTDMMGESCTISGPDLKIAFPIGDDGRYANLWGHVLNTGEPFFTNTPQSHPHAGGLPEGHVPIRRFLSMPAILADKVVGQIALANPPADFTSSHLDACQRLADLYALAIDRHRKQIDATALEQQLFQAQKLEAVGTLAGGIAHNFNNNLAIILGNLELAELKVSKDSKEALHLQYAHIAARRASELVRNIMMYSRKGHQSLKPMQMAEVVKETMNMMRSTLPSTVELESRISPEAEPLLVNADATRLQEVIINLCTNAVHAMDENGLVTVSLDPVELLQEEIPAQYECSEGQFLRFSIEDTGCGITSDIVDKIFDPFFTTKDVGQGTGIGLSTVQGIVEQHGGLIKVVSVPGQGTRFELYLPLIESEQSKTVTEAERIEFGNENILFVDDEEILAQTTSSMLSSKGYQVTTATSSVQALTEFKNDPNHFDLVITDQTMPEMTGKEFAEELLKIRPELPIILCTGYSTKITPEEATRIGVKAFLAKPIETPDLLKVVRQILGENEKNNLPDLS